MATGDQNDILTRLKALMPNGWFTGGLAPLRDALLTGWANMFAFAYSALAYVRNQTRIATASDGFLDLIAADYFGQNLVRGSNQSDASFRATILANLIRQRVTRASVASVLTQITGRAPIIFEPLRPADTGAYSTPNCGYGSAGGYGSMLLPFQAFVTAYRPIQTGIGGAAPYGVEQAATPGGGFLLSGTFVPQQVIQAAGGYGVGALEYASMSMLQNSILDSNIYAAVESVRPAGYLLWVRISN